MTTKTKPAKAAPKAKAAKVKKEPEAQRENRYSRSAKLIASNPGIDAQALSKEAAMSMSTAKHCLEAWHGITAVLLQRGAITPAWVKQLTPKAEDASAYANTSSNFKGAASGRPFFCSG